MTRFRDHTAERKPFLSILGVWRKEAGEIREGKDTAGEEVNGEISTPSIGKMSRWAWQ